MEEGRRDVEDRAAIETLVGGQSRTSYSDNAITAVPAGHGGVIVGDGARTLQAAFKTVVGDEDEHDVRAGQLKERAQHHIVKTITHFHDAAINLCLLRIDPREDRGMPWHEVVAQFIEGLEVDSEEVPRLLFKNGGGCSLQGGRFGQDDSEISEEPGGFRVGLVQARRHPG